MARKKTAAIENNTNHPVEKADEQLTNKLNQAFDMVIKQQFGSYIAPSPMNTKFGIEPLDTFLGGGIYSSAPVRFSSTPETGKSTLAYQFSKAFLSTHENGVVAYIDIEGAGNSSEESKYRLNRIETFGIDSSRFRYLPMILDLNGVFNIIQQFVNIKREIEQSQGKEFYVCIVWDSIAATPSSKTAEAETHDSIIGFKARQLTFLLDKYASLFAFNKITFIIIDQVRANLKIEGPYVQKEKTVGTFKDYKAASSISSLDHRTSQWMFLSKKKDITLSDGMGIDGWYMIISTEKNKHAPSKLEIEVVFDKAKGIDKFWTEFHFISELTPIEAKLYKSKTPPYPLLMKKSGAWYYLEVSHPETGEVHYTSEKFYKKNAKEKYKSDENFRQFFDAAVEMSVYFRIIQNLFRYDQNIIENAKDEINDTEEDTGDDMQPLMSEPDETTDEMQPLMSEPDETTDEMQPLMEDEDNDTEDEQKNTGYVSIYN